MLVVIALFLLLTEQFAGGSFAFFLSVFFWSFYFLDYRSFLRLPMNSTWVAQNIVRGLLPQVVNFWNATTSPRAI
jgi:hypothetical protein